MMISLGFLTIHPQQEVEYVTEIAKHASEFSIEIYRFTPFNIHPNTENIEGFRYDLQQEKWIEDSFLLPSFIYDRCFYRKDSLSKKARPIVNWLKQREDVTFLGHGLPNKLDVYEVIKKDSYLSSYIPPTTPIESVEQLVQLLRTNDSLMIKPANGSQGKGIVKLRQRGREIEASYQQNDIVNTILFSSFQEFKSWFTKTTHDVLYIAQPHISFFPYERTPFDIRLLLQKGNDGAWKEIGRGIRQGERDSIVTNVSSGASIVPFENLLPRIPRVHRQYVMDEINTICKTIPSVLEDHFPSLFELGIDLCISRDFSIWILDLNSKPGRKIVMETAPEQKEVMYKNVLSYCVYLANTLSYRKE
ncbi:MULTISPECIES: YheC/YheD family protein [Priestia]|uniref:YheC/YheD family endospore coat-associated protein n=1 Tax=Priestia TaxID=2800373 RepID=UPI0021D66BE0|nr:YheC/YheD family protein [Priestia megaterium]MCU7740699.1 YheC/YheD family protein [Priestia megaterium]MCU7746101.1 YheC/YheD family protein [Priestia megaterium]